MAVTGLIGNWLLLKDVLLISCKLFALICLRGKRKGMLEVSRKFLDGIETYLNEKQVLSLEIVYTLSWQPFQNSELTKFLVGILGN